MSQPNFSRKNISWWINRNTYYLLVWAFVGLGSSRTRDSRRRLKNSARCPATLGRAAALFCGQHIFLYNIFGRLFEARAERDTSHAHGVTHGSLSRQLGHEKVRSRTRPASSSASMTASQKEGTASQSPSLRIMAWTNAGRARSTSPTTSPRILPCTPPFPSGGPHCDDTQGFTPALLETGAYQRSGALVCFCYRTWVSGKHVRQAVVEDAVAPLKLRLKERTYNNL